MSGLPRSGTSLMMQMLAAGGCQPKTDGIRQADVDNPRGYLEWEEIKQVASRPDILDETGLEKKAIKVVSALLPKLPYRHRYKVIFMTRPVEEVVASQQKMIERVNPTAINESRDELARQLVQHRQQSRAWMKQNRRVEFIEIDYPSLVRNPQSVIPLIVEFIGAENVPHPADMVSAVDVRLHRQK